MNRPESFAPLVDGPLPFPHADEACIGEIIGRDLLECGPDVPLHFTAFHPDYKMGDLPRTPPMKAGVSYQYQGENWSGQFGLTHYAKQDKIAVDETVTAGYTLVDANISYDFDLSALDLTAYLKATNLTDKLGFVHSSFVKEDVPLPGRSLALGLTARF